MSNEAQNAIQTHKTRWHVPTWGVLVALVMAFFLVTDKSPENSCIHNIVFFDVAVIPHNCDSASIVSTLNNIPVYLTEDSIWKGRPVYMMTGYILGQMVMPIAKPFWSLVLEKNSVAVTYKKEFGRGIEYHISFIVLNFLIVFLVARYAMFLSGYQVDDRIALALAVSVASIDLVEGFLYVLHTPIFNLLAGFGAVAYALFGITAPWRKAWHTTVLGLLLGLGVLAYPSIAIAGPAYLIGMGYGYLRWRKEAFGHSRWMLHAILFCVFALFLPLSWFGTNTYLFGVSTYQEASTYGQFTWPLQVWEEGRLFEAALSRLLSLFSQMGKFMGVELSLSAAAITLLVLMAWSRRWACIKDPAVFALVVSILGVVSFNFLQDLYVPRMTMSVLALLYVGIARISFVTGQERLGSIILAGLSTYQLLNAGLYTSVQYG